MKATRKPRCCKNVFLLALVVIIVTGCTPSKTPASSTDQAPDSETAAPVNTIEAPTAESGQNSRVIIVIPEDPPSFNAAVGDTGYDALAMELVMLGMTDLTPDGEIITELAQSLPTVENGDVVVDEDAGTMDVTWKMRQDIQWQDGVQVTADDVIFTYEAVADPDTGGWIPGIDYIDGVEKIDDFSFVVHYNSIYAGYLVQFGGEQVVIWPKHYCNAEEGFIAWECARQPLSNGPYYLEEWEVGDHLTFLRNPNYYQIGKPDIDQIIIQIVPDATVRKTMLAKGDADVYMWVTEPVAADLTKETNVTVSISPSNRWVMRLIFNLAARGSIDPVTDPHPILSDKRVRQAIRYAIDVDLITREIFLGFTEPVWMEFSRVPYKCDIPKPPFDVEMAKALLEEAGWKDNDNDGVRECHGCLNAEEGYQMRMELITYTEFGEALVLTQQLIAEMLKKVGIDLKLSVIEGSVLWADYASGGIEQRGDFDIDLYDDGYPGLDPTDFLWQYYAFDAAAPDSGWNVGRWFNDEFETLLGEVYTLDEAYRKEKFCQIAALLDDELPQILLFSTMNADAFNNTHVDGILSSMNDVVTWNVADWTIVK